MSNKNITFINMLGIPNYVNISKEDYLGEIYRIQFCNNRAAKITEIASALKISKPSVSEMIKKLKAWF